MRRTQTAVIENTTVILTRIVQAIRKYSTFSDGEAAALARHFFDTLTEDTRPECIECAWQFLSATAKFEGFEEAFADFLVEYPVALLPLVPVAVARLFSPLVGERKLAQQLLTAMQQTRDSRFAPQIREASLDRFVAAASLLRDALGFTHELASSSALTRSPASAEKVFCTMLALGRAEDSARGMLGILHGSRRPTPVLKRLIAASVEGEFQSEVCTGIDAAVQLGVPELITRRGSPNNLSPVAEAYRLFAVALSKE